jgi:hypothetical protein
MGKEAQSLQGEGGNMTRDCPRIEKTLVCIMKATGTTLKGFTIKDGKVIRIPGYGLSSSAKIAQKTKKTVRVDKGKIR